MPGVRIFIIVLVLLNLIAFASTQGWLGTSRPRGEPERLSNQLNPERIVPTAPSATPTPTPAAISEAPPSAPEGVTPSASVAAPESSCIALAGLADQATETLLAGLRTAQPELQAAHLTSATPSSWWVRIPPSGGREGAERKVAELRALGIQDLFIVQDAGPHQHAISLGLFKSEAKAQQHLAFLQSKRVRSASITTRSATVHRIEVRGPAALLATLSDLAVVRQSGATTAACEP